MKKFFVIYNPSSGSGRSIKYLKRFKKSLIKSSIPFDLNLTESEEHIFELSRKGIQDYKDIIVVGGDTTFNFVVREVLNSERDIKLGFFGTGSANDISHSLGIDKLNNFIKIIKNSSIKELNVIEVDINNKKEICLGAIVIGSGVYVNEYIERVKRENGVKVRGIVKQSYFAFKALKEYLRDLSDNKYILEFNKKKSELNSSLMVFSNIPFFANGMLLFPELSPFDENVGFMSINPKTINEYLKYFSKIKLMRSFKGITKEFSKEYVIKSESPFDFQIDGKIFSGFNKMALKSLNKKVKIYS